MPNTAGQVFFRCSYAYVSLSSQTLRDMTISIETWKRFSFYADTFGCVIPVYTVHFYACVFLLMSPCKPTIPLGLLYSVIYIVEQLTKIKELCEVCVLIPCF